MTTKKSDTVDEPSCTPPSSKVVTQPSPHSTSEEPLPTSAFFAPYDPPSLAPKIPSGLPPKRWTLVHSAPANFAPDHFLHVTRNLLANPNLTASHLSRAELSYQSFNDATFNPQAQTPEELASIVRHLRPECRPQLIEGGGVDGYELEYTVVRKLVPRNPKLDASIMQTCHLFVSERDIVVKGGGRKKGEEDEKEEEEEDEEEETVKAERYMVIYIPHVTEHERMPFYHPKVRALAIIYTFFPPSSSSSPSTLVPLVLPNSGILSIHYDLFPTLPLDNRLARTALKLLQVIHKHARGQAGGYTKRVQHDQVVGQKRFQDTYAHLKGKYARLLIESWVEQTPPEKHVFEDLGIAAFLEEVWVDMYGGGPASSSSSSLTEEQEQEQEEEKKEGEGEGETIDQQHRKTTAQANFPGFVDIGCGNGLLVHILNNQGWHGWGFDARKRKTWDTFPSAHTAKLRQMLLVPEPLLQQQQQQPLPVSATTTTTTQNFGGTEHHNGVFPPGTFIVSNHADELTPWTPLLACLNASPFIAIPCCSHDFAGTRFRAPVHAKHLVHDPTTVESKKNKAPSAYASLCSWLCHLTEATGYKVEKEHLRIPSTRNIAVLGRTVRDKNGQGQGQGHASTKERLSFLSELVEKEMGGQTIGQVCEAWMKSGHGLLKPGKGGH